MEGFLNSDVVIIIFDVLILLLGGYLIFNAIKMKKTDQMPNILLTPKELKYCKNPYEFIDYMFKYLLIFGIVCTVFGIVSLLGDTVLDFPRIYDGIMVVILLGVWFWFSVMLRKAKQKFM